MTIYRDEAQSLSAFWLGIEAFFDKSIPDGQFIFFVTSLP